MASPRTLVLATILCLHALPAGAQSPAARRAAIDPAAADPIRVSRSVLPDLTCEITAYTDDGVPVPNPVPIPSGAQLTYAPGTKTYVKVSLKRMPQAGGDYDASVSVRQNGVEVVPAVYGSPHVAAGIGEHVISPVALLTYASPSSNQVQVYVRTDTGGAVVESNEGNNACRMAIGVQVQ